MAVQKVVEAEKLKYLDDWCTANGEKVMGALQNEKSNLKVNLIPENHSNAMSEDFLKKITPDTTVNKITGTPVTLPKISYKAGKPNPLKILRQSTAVLNEKKLGSATSATQDAPFLFGGILTRPVFEAENDRSGFLIKEVSTRRLR